MKNIDVTKKSIFVGHVFKFEGMKKGFIFIVISAWILMGCGYKDVKSDAKSYCACKEREYNGETSPGECAKLLQRLKNKYEFLPEQQEILALEIADCLAAE